MRPSFQEKLLDSVVADDTHLSLEQETLPSFLSHGRAEGKAVKPGRLVFRLVLS